MTSSRCTVRNVAHLIPIVIDVSHFETATELTDDADLTKLGRGGLIFHPDGTPALTINKVPNWEKILSKHQGLSILRRSRKQKDVKPSTDKRKRKPLALRRQETPAYKQASRVDQESDSNGDATSSEDDPLPK